MCTWVVHKFLKNSMTTIQSDLTLLRDQDPMPPRLSSPACLYHPAASAVRSARTELSCLALLTGDMGRLPEKHASPQWGPAVLSIERENAQCLKVVLRVSKNNSAHHKLQLSLHTAASNIHFLKHRRCQTARLPQEASIRVLCLLEGEVPPAMTVQSP